jgi:hypothetical protein
VGLLTSRLRSGRRPLALGLGAIGLFLATVHGTPAIETDQYYAWGRTVADATDVLNAKFNLELERVLDRVARHGPEGASCHAVRKRIVRHFRLLIYHDLELWALQSPLVERVPATAEEEFEFRRRYLYHDHGSLDPVRLIPPSPTIELGGVRLGTDKLTHFLSEGWWYFRWYRNGVRRGMSEAEAERRAIGRGILTERTLLGMGASGVFSLADLEANYQGMRFLEALCEGERPLLVRSAGGWVLREPVDFRDYVTPEWDESFQPSIYSPRRWKRVRPVLHGYCPLLEHPEVRERRERYARQDRMTPTEVQIQELVARGKLPDPAAFSIDRVCGEAPEITRSGGSSRP